VLWGLLLYPNFRAWILGQLAVFVLLALAGMLWALRRDHPGWAGVCLALTLVKPQLVYLAVPWVLWWAASRRQWRLWGGFCAASAVLLLLPMLVLPSWIPSFWAQAVAYPSYTVYGSLAWIVVRGLGLGRPVEIAVQVALAAAALSMTWRFRKGSRTQLIWVLGLLLLLTNVFTPRIATTHLVVLLPWVIWSLAEIGRSAFRHKRWALAGIVAALLVVPWATFLATIEGDFERAPAYLPFPAAVAVLLAWLGFHLSSVRRIGEVGG
jgi:hypothetical protein